MQSFKILVIEIWSYGHFTISFFQNACVNGKNPYCRAWNTLQENRNEAKIYRIHTA